MLLLQTCVPWLLCPEIYFPGIWLIGWERSTYRKPWTRCCMPISRKNCQGSGQIYKRNVEIFWTRFSSLVELKKIRPRKHSFSPSKDDGLFFLNSYWYLDFFSVPFWCFQSCEVQHISDYSAINFILIFQYIQWTLSSWFRIGRIWHPLNNNKKLLRIRFDEKWI